MKKEIFEIDWRNDPNAFARSFFNAMGDYGFLPYFKHASDFESVIFDATGCCFPHEAEEAGYTSFDGVKFYFLDEEIVVDFTTFKKIAIEAGEIYAVRNPTVAAEIRKIIEELKTRNYIKSDYMKP